MLFVLLRATIIEEQFPHRVKFLIVIWRQIQNKALNPLKQCSTLSCWPPQVIQSRRSKKIVLSPRDYSLEDEQSMLSSCEDSISGSVTEMKTLIKKIDITLKKKKKRKKKNNIKEVTAAEFISEAEATVALNAALE